MILEGIKVVEQAHGLFALVREHQLEVRFKDGFANPGVRREYVGKADFETSSRSLEGALP